MAAYIESSFGGAEQLKKMILCDFFRHGFDGSGADNFFDAGSCIDGRLTSAWNWCSKLERKAYFPVFQLTNFMYGGCACHAIRVWCLTLLCCWLGRGFDGDFR